LKDDLMRAFLASVSLLASGTAAAGVVMEMTDRNLVDPDTKPGTQKLWFESGSFRVDSIESDGLDTSVIFKNQTMYAIDHGDRSYTVMDKASMDRAAAQIGAMRKKMEAQMAGMPPEQRAMIEKMMQDQGMPGGKSAPAVPRVVKASGRSDTVSGRTCRMWEVSQGGKKLQELCVVAPGSLPGGNELMKSMRDMTEMSRSFFEKIGAGEDAMEDAWADLEKIKGIPILTRDFEDGRAVDETRLTAIREQALGSTVFDIPKGFKEQKMDAGLESSE
jgi:hypothetical protein